MRQQRAKLGRLQRELERRQRQREGRPAITQIEVWCNGKLREVMTLGTPTSPPTHYKVNDRSA